MPSKNNCVKLVGRALLGFLVLLILLVGLIFIFRQQIGRYVLKRTVILLGKAISGEVSYKAIEGDIFSHPQMIELRLVRESDTVFIEKIEVRYNIIALLQRRIELLSVKIVDPDVRIARERAKAVVREGKTVLTFPNLRVQQLEIINGRVTLAGLKRIDAIGLKSNFSCSGATLKLNLDSAGCRLTQEGITIRRIGTKVTLAEGLLTLSDLQVITSSSELAGDFRFDINSGAITVDTFNLSLNIEEIADIPGKVWLRGKGKFGKERVAEALGRTEGFFFQQIRLPSLSGRFSLVDSVLTVFLSGADEIFGGLVLDASLNLANCIFSANVKFERVSVNKFDSSLPEFSLSAIITAQGRAGTVAELLKMSRPEITGDSVELILQGRAMELGVDTVYATVNYNHQRLELRKLVLFGQAGRFDFDGWARKGSVVASCNMTDFDLAIAGKFLSFPLTGRADGKLNLVLAKDSWGFSGLVRVQGFATRWVEVTNGLIQADLGGTGFVSGVGHNRLAGRVAVGGEGVKIAGQEWNWAQFVWTGPEFDLQVEKDEHRLIAAGDIFFEKSNIATVLRVLELSVQKETVALYDSCLVRVGGDSLSISGLRIKVAEGQMDFSAASLRGRMPELNIRARNLNLHKLQQLLGFGGDLSGTLNFDVTGQETLFFAFSGADVEIPAANFVIKQMQGNVLLTREGACLKSLSFVHQTDTSNITGTMQFDTRNGFHLTGLDFDITLADPGSWPFVVTKPYVEISEGQLYGIAKVKWRPENLSLTGRIRVNHGTLSVPSIQGKVERFQAELSLRDNRIILEKLSGRTTKGILTAEGFAQLSPKWNCDSLRYFIHFTGVSAMPITAVYAIGDGDISVHWRQKERAFISGQVTISEGLATIGFGGRSLGGVNHSGGVHYDITVQAERGLWLRNRDADIELGVDLVVRKIGEDGLYSGDLIVKQGSVYYFDHILRVTEGRLTCDNSSEFDPQLNITAECPLPEKRGNIPDKIILKLTGTLASPSFTFYSEPPLWDETQIITYLSLNVTIDELSALEEKELISRLLSERLLSYFQTQASKRVRDFIGLDYLEVQTGLTGDEARVTVGKYVGRNLYVSYTQNFTGELQPAFRVEYNLNRRNELLAERSPQGRYSFRYRFKLRF